MKALILIQDELINRLDNMNYGVNDGSSEDGAQKKKPEDRIIVLCIAYHNIAVE